MAKPEKDSKKVNRSGKDEDQGVNKKESTLSDEDIRIMEGVDLCVSRIQDSNLEIASSAVDQLGSMMRDTYSNSLTGIPKPLKYLRPHIPSLTERYEALSKIPNTGLPENFLQRLSDILSILSMAFPSAEKQTQCLDWKRKGTLALDIWGHHYVRQLSTQFVTTWKGAEKETQLRESLLPLLQEIVQFEFSHNGEPNAVDLLLEIDRMDLLTSRCTMDNYVRTCDYLLALAPYLPEGEDGKIYRHCGELYQCFGALYDAMRMALKLSDHEKAKELLDLAAADPLVQQQLLILCNRHGAYDLVACCPAWTDLQEKIPEYFLHCSKALDALEPKAPEEVAKPHLMDQRTTLHASNTPRYLRHLAYTLLSGFSNAGFGTDKLTTLQDNEWLHGQREQRVISAVASVALLHLGNPTEGLNALEKYLSSENVRIRAGAALGVGVVCHGVCSQFDPALSLLTENLYVENTEIRMCSILGLGLAYAGTRSEQILSILVPFVADSSMDISLQSFAALALGFVFVGTAHEDLVETMLLCLMEKESAVLTENFTAPYLILGLGLLFLGQQDRVETLLSTVHTLSSEVRVFIETLLTALAYAGTGNVLIVQKLLHLIREGTKQTLSKDKRDKESDSKVKHNENTDPKPSEEAGTPAEDVKPKEGSAKGPDLATLISGQSARRGVRKPKSSKEVSLFLRPHTIATLGIGLVAFGENIGREVACRVMDHILHFGDLHARRALPLCIALLSLSDPHVTVLETLSKLSHDTDAATAQAAIFAIGLVGAGTRSVRAATMLRSLCGFHVRNPECWLLCHIALGLVELGKGQMTLRAVHSDGLLASSTSLCGILTAVFSMLTPEVSVAKYSYLWMSLAASMRPRHLILVDGEGKPLEQQPVRVGTAVDTVAMAGKPKRITGFQTQNSPVVLQSSDRAELPPSAVRPVAKNRILEGIVFTEKDPEHEASV